MGAAALGAASYIGGNALDAYGQNQALRAMQHVWDVAQQRQGAIDSELQGNARDLVAHAGIDANRNAEGEAALRKSLDTATTNTAAAAQKNLQLRPGTANSGRVSAGFQSALADALRRSGATSKLQAMQQGGNNVDMAGRTFAVGRQDLQNRSREWASLVPLLQAAAGMKGGVARGIGQTFQMGGKGLMSYGMSQPASGSADPGVADGGIFSPGAADMRGSIYDDSFTGLRTAQT